MRRPRILIVTPEITYLPEGMGNLAQRMHAKAGGLADVSASLVAALHDQGADVHVALPNYRQMFHVDVFRLVSKELRTYYNKLPKDRIHLAEDRIFYYRDQVYSSYDRENHRIALIFQREVMNNIIRHVRPDLIHCNDWMTGLVPAFARRLDIPTLFTVHNIHTEEATLETIEETGIDAAQFWPFLFYKGTPDSYEAARKHNPVDFLCSGVFAAHFINTVSPAFLNEVAEGWHDFVPGNLRQEIANKRAAGCARGILNAPDASFDPATDPDVAERYDAETHEAGKAANKRALQERLNLLVDPGAPIFFWPSRLDPLQKGCELLAHILYQLVSDYWHERLQVVLVANGRYQGPFHQIVHRFDLQPRVAVANFEEGLSRLAFAGSDYVLMPSRFEPCGLPQMISALYGSLPVVHNTGGLRDTISHLSVADDRGNGFVFEHYSAEGLRWAIDQAMRFHALPQETKSRNIARIMKDGASRFNHSETAKAYIKIYEDMLRRPLVKH